MRTQLDLTQAVERLYGNSLIDISTPASEWHFFTPYCLASSKKTLYFKLLELPASFHTSQEICAYAKQKFGDVLHQVQFLFVQRTFQSCIYLLKANSNIQTIRSLIKLRRESGENMEEDIIFKFLEFVHVLEEHKFSKNFGFDLDQIGLDESGNFVLANYELYFKECQQEDRNLNKDTRRVLESLIMLSQESFSLMDLYSRAQEQYGEVMMQLVEKCMKMEFKTSEAMTIIESSKQSDEWYSRGTITDSYISDMDKLDETLGQNSFSDGPSFTKIKKIRKNRKRLLGACLLIFIGLMAGVGFFVFQYFTPQPIICGQAEYLDKEAKKCMACTMGCQRCENGGQATCFSCKGDLFLVMADSAHKLGYCSQNCKGQIIAPKTCIYKSR